MTTYEEICDEGDNRDDIGCFECLVIEPGYNCDDVGEPCTSSCGNGRIDDVRDSDGVFLYREVCDDGDTISGNGCESDCMSVTFGYQCPSNGGKCNDNCGNGILDLDMECDIDTIGFLGCLEVCDDGNLEDGDGCTYDCQVETDYTCSRSEDASELTNEEPIYRSSCSKNS